MNTALNAAVEGVTGENSTPVKGKEYFDMYFRAVPVATEHAGDSVCWDMIFRMNIPAKFELYERTGENGEWVKKDTDDTTGKPSAEINSTDGTLQGTSYTRNFVSGNSSSSTALAQLNAFRNNTTRYFGIRFTSLNNIEDRGTWSDHVEMQIEAMASTSQSALHNLAVSNMTNEDLNTAIEDGVVQIGSPTPFKLKHTFQDSTIPEFQLGYPRITPSDTSGSIDVQLTRTTGIIYYVIAPVETITTELTKPLGEGTRASTTLTAWVTNGTEKGNWNYLPATTAADRSKLVFSSVPTSGNIMTPPYTDPSIIKGKVSYYGSNVSIPLKGLKPETQYVAYFVLQGSSSTIYSENPYVFGFETTEVSRPNITLEIYNPSVAISSNYTSTVDWLLTVNEREPSVVQSKMVDCTGTKEDEFKSYIQDKYPTKDANTMTVLEAMCTDYIESNGKVVSSVFDKFASDTKKAAVAAGIRSQTTTGSSSIAGKGQVTVNAGGTAYVNCEPYLSADGTFYTFLCVGKSDSGSGDAFRAIYSVFKASNEAPKVTFCNFDGSVGNDGNFYGLLTINFDRPLYYRVDKDGKQLKLPVVNGTAPDASNKYQLVSDTFTAGVGYTLQNANNNPGTYETAVESIQYQLQGARPRSAISASLNLCDKDGHVRSPGLSITLNYTTNENGVKIPTYEISKGWDATK